MQTIRALELLFNPARAAANRAVHMNGVACDDLARSDPTHHCHVAIWEYHRLARAQRRFDQERGSFPPRCLRWLATDGSSGTLDCGWAATLEYRWHLGPRSLPNSATKHPIAPTTRPPAVRARAQTRRMSGLGAASVQYWTPLPP